jgi:integrase
MSKSTSGPVSEKKPPRRKSVEGKNNNNIYVRPDKLYEVGYRDSTGKQRWRVDGYPSTFQTIAAARVARDVMLSKKGKGERVVPNPKLKFGEASSRWLTEQVSALGDGTGDGYESHLRNHLLPRWGNRLCDSIDVGEALKLVQEMRAAGYAEWTISGVLRVASRVFKFARRHCGWHGDDPIALLEKGEGAKVSNTPERRIYVGDELAQVLDASAEPWTTLFRLAGVMGGRESEYLGLWWENFNLEDLDASTIRFEYQVNRKGQRVKLKTAESKATLPLPRSTAAMMLQHKARSPHAGARSYVFATRIGGPLGQRNVLRALYRAQEQARKPDGTPTFPDLFEHDERGHMVVNDKGEFVLTKTRRRDLPPLPDFHALRHTAAMDCDDAEEARDLLRHKNSNVTRAIYRGHFDDRRRESLRAKLEARHAEPIVEAPMEAGDLSEGQEAVTGQTAEVVQLRA